MAFYELEPWGSSLEGVRSAVATAAIYNSGFNKPKNKVFYPKDFYVGVYTGPSKQQTWQEQRARLEMAIPVKKRSKPWQK